ncbi:MAG TPA: S-layer homology domain-containing protein [Bacillus sp. (in: firmicutes)]|nr:S-layer homology domain-containing protein [Bacillus sp. (in: firmicutes)]
MFKNKKMKKFLATTATAAFLASTLIPTGASAATFTDVPESHVHFEAIDVLSDEGIINGYGDGTFKPGNTITRGQAAKIFARLFEEQGELQQVFEDVPVTHADQELVRAAFVVNDYGVMTGSNGYLYPAKNITRQQMAKMLVETFDLYDLEEEESTVKDLDKAYPEFREYIEILSEWGVTNVEEFRPTDSVSRAQFASFVYRSLLTFEEQE